MSGLLRIVVFALAALCGACGGEGRLLITLERPDGVLDPLSDRRLARFSLRVTRENETNPTEQDAFLGQGKALTVGSVPVDAPLDLRLAGRSASGLVLGLGQVLRVVVPPTGETRVAVKLRKPLGYVAGQSRVQVIDAAAESTATLELAPVQVPGAGAVAAAANGVLLLVAAQSELVPVRTQDHKRLPALKLSAAATCLGASPNHQVAVVCHADQRTVGVVDLQGLTAGQGSERVVPVTGKPAAVVFGPAADRATVLLDAQGPTEACAGKKARAITVALDSAKGSDLRGLDAPVADIAHDPRDGALLLALPCHNKVRRLPAGGGSASDVAVSAPYDLAVADRNLVLLGRAAGSPVRGEATLLDLSAAGTGLGKPQSRPFSLSGIVIALRTRSTSSGSFGWTSEPTALTFSDVAVTPDSQRAVALFRAQYASDVTFDTCTYRTSLSAVGYLLMDLSAGTVLVQRYTRLSFSQCYANCVVNAQGYRLTDTATCASEMRRVLRAQGVLLDQGGEFEPTGAAILFGDT